MSIVPPLSPEALQQRYALLCESTRPEPDDTLLPYPVEQGLAALDKLLGHDLRALARQEAPSDFADLHQALEHELNRLREFCAFPALAGKFVVAFGGGFSAGKSSLINALLGHKLLVTEVDPTTSLPTYLLQGSRDEVSALNLFGHRVLLDEAQFLSLTHDEAQVFGSHIGRLLRAAFITRRDFAWSNLALIDTPGYSKDQSDAHSERTDEHLARTQLNAAHALVWVVDARQGCITEDDLAFLSGLKSGLPLFIALSRADQKPEAEIPAILSVIAKALQAKNMAVAGMAAFSARKPRAWPLEPLLKQLGQWNAQAASQPQLAQGLQAGFARFDAYLVQQQAQAQDDLNRLNRILALSDHRDAQTEATQLKERTQTRLTLLKDQGEKLEALWQAVGTQLQALGQQAGLVLPRVGVLRTPPVPHKAAQVDPGAQKKYATADSSPSNASEAKRATPKQSSGLSGVSLRAAQIRHVETRADTLLAQVMQLKESTASLQTQPGDILCAGEGFPELVMLPSGRFQMGGDGYSDEKPVHTVEVRAFAMGKHPVTQAQWKKVMGKNPSYFTGDDRRPVDNVSWEDAKTFIEKLNRLTGHVYRLPSEAEWEYACRAGSTGKWCFGNGERSRGEYAWYSANSGGQTHPVGQKKSNAWGLYDMHGNVWEWCEDTWHENYEGAPTDGSAWVQGVALLRVVRGGSWSYKARYSHRTYHFSNIGNNRYDFVGFRVARTAP